MLVASDGAPHDGFGKAIAVSTDGTVLVVGAPDRGGAYVYHCSPADGTCEEESEQSVAAADGGAGSSYFGGGVALSAGASILVVSASRRLHVAQATSLDAFGSSPYFQRASLRPLLILSGGGIAAVLVIVLARFAMLQLEELQHRRYSGAGAAQN
jgi:hypothetical protein